jgi:hypothetical protein
MDMRKAAKAATGTAVFFVLGPGVMVGPVPNDMLVSRQIGQRAP